MNISVAFDLRPREQFGLGAAGQRKGGGIEAERRQRSEIDRDGMRSAGLVHNHESDPAKPTVPRLERREREGRRYRGVDRGSTRRQNLGAYRRRGAILRSDKPIL